MNPSILLILVEGYHLCQELSRLFLNFFYPLNLGESAAKAPEGDGQAVKQQKQEAPYPFLGAEALRH